MLGKSTWEKIWNNRAYLKKSFLQFARPLGKKTGNNESKKNDIEIDRNTFYFFFRVPDFLESDRIIDSERYDRGSVSETGSGKFCTFC